MFVSTLLTLCFLCFISLIRTAYSLPTAKIEDEDNGDAPYLKRRWPNKTIMYEISPNITKPSREMIYKAINEFHVKTCLKFVGKKKSDEVQRYIYFTNNEPGCFCASNDKINLGDAWCTDTIGSILHEILHALGFAHEELRSDRDDYITVNYTNIEKGRENVFDKKKPKEYCNEAGPYDYYSLMHLISNVYGKDYYSQTLIPKKDGVKLTFRYGFSEMDVQKLRKVYECSKQSDQPVHKKNVSGLDPKETPKKEEKIGENTKTNCKEKYGKTRKCHVTHGPKGTTPPLRKIRKIEKLKNNTTEVTTNLQRNGKIIFQT